MTSPLEIAGRLLQATALSGDIRLADPTLPGFTSVDYHRIACHLLFRCHRCGTCCTTGDPIKLRQEDLVQIARHLKIPVNRASRKLTVSLSGSEQNKPVLGFKKVRPCKFFDPVARGCKIYSVRPWSCRIFPFLGIYGSEDQVLVHKSCPGSVEAMEVLTAALEEVRSSPEHVPTEDPQVVMAARRWFNEQLGSL